MGKFLSTIVFFLALIFITNHFFKNWDQVQLVLDMGWKEIVGVYFLLFLSSLINAAILQLLVSKIGAKMSLVEICVLQYTSRLFNYVPMKIGTLFRAKYLKKKYFIHYSQSTALTIYQALMTVLVSGVLGVICLVAGFSLEEYGRKMLFVVFAANIMVALIVLHLPLSRSHSRVKFVEFLRKTSESKNIYSRDLIVNLRCLVLLSALLALTSIRLLIIYNGFGYQVSIFGGLILSSAGIVAVCLGVTPGGLGLRELFLGVVSVALGIPLTVGLFVAAVDRILMLSVVFSLGGGSYWLLSRFES